MVVPHALLQVDRERSTATVAQLSLGREGPVWLAEQLAGDRLDECRKVAAAWGRRCHSSLPGHISIRPKKLATQRLTLLDVGAADILPPGCASDSACPPSRGIRES